MKVNKRTISLALCFLMAVALILTSVQAAPAGEKPQYGGTFTFVGGVSGLKPTTWDPNDYIYVTGVYVGPYFGKLVMGDLDKGPRGSKIFSFQTSYAPQHAIKGYITESWEWTDSSTFEFKIRKGVKWQGKKGVMETRQVTADDVVFSFKRFWKDARIDTTRWKWIDEISAPDKWTVRIKANSFSTDWHYAIGYGAWLHIYPPEVVKAGIHDWRNHTGMGPFIVSEYIRDSLVVYERNPSYWEKIKIDGKEYQLPFVDKIMWPIIPDESTRMAALRTGKADLHQSVKWHDVEPLAKTNPDLVKYKYLYASNGYIGFRMDKPDLPFQNKKVRRAMSMAIDYNGAIKALFGGEGDILSFSMPSYWDTIYTPMEKMPKSIQENFSYNPEKAKQLLAEAGYPKGFKFKVVGSNAHEDYLSLYASYWEAIGIEAEIKIVDYSSWASIRQGQKHKQAIYGQAALSTPGITWMQMGVCGGINNHSQYCDKSFDEKYFKAIQTMDTAERHKIYKEMNLQYLEAASHIPVPASYYNIFTWPWVKNYYGETGTGWVDYHHMYARLWIDKDMKKKMGYK